jgi:hypothetical protein
MWEHHPAVGMRVADEQVTLLHHRSESGTQREQRDGCQDPSVACGASRVCAGEMFITCGCPRVPAKVSGVLCCVRSVGNGNLAVRGSCVTSQDAAHRDMRGHLGLGLRQRLPLGDDEPDASRQSSLLNQTASLLKMIRGVGKTPFFLGKKQQLFIGQTLANHQAHSTQGESSQGTNVYY